MTHNDSPSKTPQRADFLAALYTNVNPALWLEIRCIHPQTAKTRVLWASIGNPKQIQAVLRQADALNRSGFGVYFAPCLRQEKKGSAATVAAVPALWVDIDCDNGVSQRSAALDNLHAFEPSPSIIVDSGGGWHAYWLLDEPFVLTSDEDRQRIADILKGLFSALGGDEDYAKSVASLMRLPNSINTKPERGGLVGIVELNANRRFPLAEFDWLAVTPLVNNFSMALPINGHAPLPPMTLNYLTQGASNGNRNRLLFDAACQFRDAGYSYGEAEAQLLPRYVADGTGNENPTTREREVRATLASVYQQAPRDPIVSPSLDAHQMVNNLVQRFSATEKQSQPSVSEIAEAVRACAHLDAIEWAAQRQRLKDLCGNGVRVTDLDRQYRQAHKALERERRQAEQDESEEYYENDGKMIYRVATQRGTIEKTIASWTGHITERISQVNDDGQVEHLANLELSDDYQTMKLQVPSDVFGDDAALRRFIAGRAGEVFTVRAGMGKHLAPAILSLSGDYPHRTCYRFMGWTQIDGHWTYIAPGLSVNAKGVLNHPPEVDLDARLRDYRLQEVAWEDGLKAFEAMIPVFPKQLAPTCIAFALLPLLQSFFPAAAPRPAIHLTGTYGSGKSELAALMSSFYGNFSRDTPPAQWGDTINTVEAVGYPLASALYWVDDYKTIYADERTFTRFLQSYSRGMGRGRLTREAKLRQERPCRGLLLSTGETVLEGEASVLSRMLVLDVPPWEHRDPYGEALHEAESLRQHLTGFTVTFAQWIAHQVEEHDLAERLVDEFGISVEGYRKKLQASGITMANTGRLIQNWAVLVTTYRILLRFLEAQNADEILSPWQDVLIETAQTVRQERASEVFLNTLSQLLASGEVILATNTKNPEEPRPGTTLIGYRDKDHLYLLPEVTFRAVNRVQPLKFTVSAIGSQLKEEGYLIPGNSSSHLTTQIRIRENRVRVWQLKAEILNGDSGDNGDMQK